jgi:hypothetical protein
MKNYQHEEAVLFLATIPQHLYKFHNTTHGHTRMITVGRDITAPNPVSAKEVSCSRKGMV